jgi:hypothetical protein
MENNKAIVTDGYCQCDRPVIYCDVHRDSYFAEQKAKLDSQIADSRASEPVNDADVVAFWGDQAPADIAHRNFDTQARRLVGPSWDVPLTEQEIADLES